MLEISHTACSMARSCQHKYKLRYVDGIKPLRKSEALAIGEILHQAFDRFYRGQTDKQVVAFITDTMDDQLLSSNSDTYEDLSVTKAILLGMWNNYPYKDLTQFEEIASEKEFRTALNDKVLYVGKIDRLVKKDGQWWISELKTSGLPFNVFKNRVSVSDQPTGYVWACRKQGIPVEGVVYDYVKKPSLRKGIRENMNSFTNRIGTDYKLRPSLYFGSHYEYRSDEDVERWVRDTEQQAEAIKGIWNGKHYRNTDSCFMYNSECAYKKICFTEKPDPLTMQLYFEQKGTSHERV